MLGEEQSWKKIGKRSRVKGGRWGLRDYECSSLGNLKCENVLCRVQ